MAFYHLFALVWSQLPSGDVCHRLDLGVRAFYELVHQQQVTSTLVFGLPTRYHDHDKQEQRKAIHLRKAHRLSV
jgi:hypothetical protein